MELMFLRNGGALMIGEVPAALWHCRTHDDRGIGIAGVVEIVPIPLDPGSNEALRRMLAKELAGIDPTMRLRPTIQIVQTCGTPARMWFGNMRSGMPVGAFIGCIRPENKAMDQLLSAMLDELNAVEVIRDDGIPTRIHVGPSSEGGPLR
jgi:hypothetical protein